MNIENSIGGYVFVVCGSKEHLDTLAFSFSVLEKKTRYPIYIVTDNSRNDYPLSYPNLVNTPTPKEFDHHQASIWLKTSLHRLLPDNKLYTYLDTDILAYGKNVDGIFQQYTAPIIFAPDHCKITQFSPYAVNCGCMDLFEQKRKEVNELLKKHDPLSDSNDQYLINQREKLFKVFQQSKRKGKLPVKFYLRYFTSWPTFKINHEFKLDQRKKIWFDSNNQAIMHKINMRLVAKKAGLKWNYLKNEMTLPDGRNLYSNFCSHLGIHIKNKFGVEVKDVNWQHWNGGVFVFGPQSKKFMDTWHQFTMEIFKDPQWKTRDQGTLIAAAWKLGLQNHPMLNKKWNLILDYYYPNLAIHADKKITVDGNEWIDPEFVHIYHHWGDDQWDIWNKVIANLST